MKKDPLVYLEDIIMSANRIAQYIDNLTQE